MFGRIGGATKSTEYQATDTSTTDEEWQAKVVSPSFTTLHTWAGILLLENSVSHLEGFKRGWFPPGKIRFL